MVALMPETAQIWKWLGEVQDPELPVVSIVDLGIVRGIRWEEEELVISVTPTYSGCPATEVIARDIQNSLAGHGVEKLRIETHLSPPWTTDWISDEVRERLRGCGIASQTLVQIDAVACPRCGSRATRMLSRFGSTPCKALYKCKTCLEPFDVFKRH